MPARLPPAFLRISWVENKDGTRSQSVRPRLSANEHFHHHHHLAPPAVSPNDPPSGVFFFLASPKLEGPGRRGILDRGLSVLPGDSRGTLGNAAYDYKRRVQPIAKGRRTVAPLFRFLPGPPGSVIGTMKLRLG